MCPLRMIFCDSGHLQIHRKRPDMKQKYMDSDKALWKKTSYQPWSVKWVAEQIHKARKLTFYNIKCNRRLGRSPRSPNAGVTTRYVAPYLCEKQTRKAGPHRMPTNYFTRYWFHLFLSTFHDALLINRNNARGKVHVSLFSSALCTVTSLHNWKKQGINHKFLIGNRFHVTLRIVSPVICNHC